MRGEGRHVGQPQRIAGRGRTHLPGCPFFLATLCPPELSGDGARPHPVIRALARAAVAHAGRRETV